ncbi:MAG: hypothetical protein RLZZ450_1777 [Pseudomonadota bacterium]|jgi:hypothetical protein
MNEFPGEDGLSDDALSPEVRAFLARAQRCHDVPGPEVKQRVRAAVGVVLIAAPLGAAPVALHKVSAATKLAARFGLGAKLGTSVALAALVGTGSVLLPQLSSSTVRRTQGVVSAPAASADTQVAAVDPSSTPDRAATVPAVVAANATDRAAELAPAVSVEQLAPVAAQEESSRAPVGSETRVPDEAVVDRSELSLLMAASEALDAGDAERGLALLTQHRSRFPDSALDQERRGLSLVARCMRDSSSGSARDARLAREASGFLRRFPGAVLTARIRRTCGP